MLGFAAASRRPAAVLLKIRCSSSVKCYHRTSIYQQRDSLRDDLPRRPEWRSGPPLKELPTSADDIPALPSSDLPVFNPEAASLLSTVISAPKKTSQADFQRDKNIEERLKKIFANSPRDNRGRKDKRRINIISSGLCDDILERLKPSLQEYEGCDIIDINPGVGILSSKLHEQIKPRSHILMEPDQKMYSPFLEPLLDEPGSTYSMVPKTGIIWADLETIMSEKHLPHQQAYPAGDPRLYEVNKTLLVVANLAFHPEKPYKGFTSLTRMVLYQFLSAVKANSLFHRYGLVRMLLWVGDDERTKLLPRSILNRKKSELEMELACSKVTEIVSSTKDAVVSGFRREHRLDFVDLPRIVASMTAKGITIPAGRESLLLTDWATQGSPEALKTYKPPTTESFNKAVELRDTMVAQWNTLSENELRKLLKEYKVKRSTVLTQYNNTQTYRQLLDLDGKIVALEKRLHGGAENADAIKQDIARLHDEYETIRLAKINTKATDPLNAMLDNSRALHDHVMFWDQREFEPLRALADEFLPSKELALIDLVPASWPMIRDHYPESEEVMEFILAHLFLEPTGSLKAGLKSLWPGALDWLTEHCPSLSDPTKGGWKDLDRVTVRRLTPGMVLEMLEAWFEWPWRPSRFDIMRQIGSINYDPDAMEMDE